MGRVHLIKDSNVQYGNMCVSQIITRGQENVQSPIYLRNKKANDLSILGCPKQQLKTPCSQVHKVHVCFHG
jgi:hypothetical protein